MQNLNKGTHKKIEELVKLRPFEKRDKTKKETVSDKEERWFKMCRLQ